MSQDQSTPAANKRVAYSQQEFADALGLSRQHVAKLITRGDVHAVKLGRAVRIPASELDRLLSPVSS